MDSLTGRKIELETERLIVKTISPEDVTISYVQGINDPDVYRYLLIPDKGEQSMQSIKTYVSDNINSPNALLFGIYVKEGNEFIGTTRLSGISFFHYCCDIGACVFAKQYWGKGFAREAVKEVVKYAFNTMGLHYIEAGVFSENISSIKLFCNSGFQLRNSYAEKLRLENKFADVSILCVINSKFDYGKLSYSGKS